jgi:hypothetical protein
MTARPTANNFRGKKTDQSTKGASAAKVNARTETTSKDRRRGEEENWKPGTRTWNWKLARQLKATKTTQDHP